MRILVIVDMQNDFVTGTLGTEEARKIVPKLVEYANSQKQLGAEILFTQDTHDKNYLSTLEGEKLPVEHCIKDTYGHKIIDELENLIVRNQGIDFNVFTKNTFGCSLLYSYIKELYSDYKNHICGEGLVIEFCGVCTDICVVSNALMIREAAPDARIFVKAECCAGTTPEAHEAALKVMQSCQIEII